MSPTKAAMSATMLAAYVPVPGPVETIRVGELPVPPLGADEVLVTVETVAADPVDTLVRSGAYPTRVPRPLVLGRDLVGTVLEAGSAVTDFKPGDRVWSNSMGHDGRQGSFAQYASVPAPRLYHLPAHVDPRVAVAIAHPAATAYLAWFVRARLRPGETVLVGGGVGNVGTAATQLAVRAGVRVLATARPEDHDRCRAAGADVVLDYRDPCLATAVLDHAPDGVDVVWDTSGRQDIEVSATVVADGGRIVVTAAPERATVPLRRLYTRDVAVLGMVISRARSRDLAAAAAVINQMLTENRLTARIVAELPLEAAAYAHRLLESGDVAGRQLLHPWNREGEAVWTGQAS
ncbi:NADPH:quinone reductase [Georgenia yuyongxinii]|nr:NADPH:quinone reductase [Georgenia yuyongxinii]